MVSIFDVIIEFALSLVLPITAVCALIVVYYFSRIRMGRIAPTRFQYAIMFYTLVLSFGPMIGMVVLWYYASIPLTEQTLSITSLFPLTTFFLIVLIAAIGTRRRNELSDEATTFE
ncbi:MAG: hypothetical protein ACFFCX_06285 [Candidatus Sifarchaeia archaeon]